MGEAIRVVVRELMHAGGPTPRSDLLVKYHGTLDAVVLDNVIVTIAQMYPAGGQYGKGFLEEKIGNTVTYMLDKKVREAYVNFIKTKQGG